MTNERGYLHVEDEVESIEYDQWILLEMKFQL